MMLLRCFLVLCVGAILSLALESSAAPIQYQVTVNPIQVCDNVGLNCGNPTRQLFLDETDKLWAQAGIDIKFLDWRQVNNTSYLDGMTSTSIALASGNQSMSGNVINMWFVNTLESGGYGQASEFWRSTLIGNNVFSYSGGAGRRDTIAHELGHTLGLDHIGGVDPVPNNLLEEGGDRNAVTSIDQIFPTGERGQLNASQINTTRNHTRSASLAFSIPGDIDRNGLVNQTDVDLFVQGWRHQQRDPGLDTWMKGDFNHDAVTNLDDAYILRTALAGNPAALTELAAGIRVVPVPEAATGLVLVVGLLATFAARRQF